MKRIIYIFAVVILIITTSCSDYQEDPIYDGAPYIHELFLIFEDEAGNNLVMGINSGKETSVVNENDYSLFTTDKYSNRTPIYDLSYVLIYGNRYLDFSQPILGQDKQAIKFEFACRHIFGDMTIHTIEAHFEASKESVFLRQTVSLVFDGTYYRADSDSRVVIKI